MWIGLTNIKRKKKNKQQIMQKVTKADGSVKTAVQLSIMQYAVLVYEVL